MEYIPKITSLKVIKKTLTHTEKQKKMLENCAICFTKHKMTMTCVIPCGHQFGKKCLTHWNNNTCPLCRTSFVSVTEFVAPRRRRYFTDEEIDNLTHVLGKVA